MSYHANTLISKVDRIENSDASDRVRQSKANILLEGLTPQCRLVNSLIVIPAVF